MVDRPKSVDQLSTNSLAETSVDNWSTNWDRLTLEALHCGTQWGAEGRPGVDQHVRENIGRHLVDRLSWSTKCRPIMSRKGWSTLGRPIVWKTIRRHCLGVLGHMVWQSELSYRRLAEGWPKAARWLPDGGPKAGRTLAEANAKACRRLAER